MKRWGVLYFVFCVLIPQAESLELELSGQLTNLYFRSDQLKNVEQNDFSGSDLFWNIDFAFGQSVKENLQVRWGLKTDIILRRYVFSQIDFSEEALMLSFMPFAGIFNGNSQNFTPGIGISMRYFFFGTAFIRAGISTTFLPLAQLNDHYAGSMYASLGGRLKDSGIAWLEVEYKQFTYKKDNDLTITDSSTKYYVNTEVFAKTLPVRWGIGAGCQILSQSFNSTSSQNNPTLISLLGGGHLRWEMMEKCSILFRFHTPFMIFGWHGLTYKGTSNLSVLFFAEIGLQYSF